MLIDSYPLATVIYRAQDAIRVICKTPFPADAPERGIELSRAFWMDLKKMSQGVKFGLT